MFFSRHYLFFRMFFKIYLLCLCLFLSCQCHDITAECVPGETQLCNCRIGFVGVRSCNHWNGWGDCQCVPQETGNKTTEHEKYPCEQMPRLNQPCVVGSGSCKVSGTLICSPDRQRLVCSKQPDLTKRHPYERCDNNIDDNCNGQINEDCNWVLPFHGSVESSSVAFDPQGNIYIAGYFVAFLSLEGSLYNPDGVKNLFVSKISPNGTLLWTANTTHAKETKETKETRGENIVVSPSGEVYVAGCFGSKTQFGTILLNPKNKEDVFVAKLSATGQFLWVRSGGGYEKTTDCVKHGKIKIAVSNQSHLAVTGTFVGVATFGTHKLISQGGTDLFVAKLDTEGNFLWVTSVGGIGEDYSRSIQWGSSGKLYVLGNFFLNATFGKRTISTENGPASFLAVLNKHGEWDWINTISCTENIPPLVHPQIDLFDLAIDRNENIYVLGNYSYPWFGTCNIGNIPHHFSPDTIFVSKVTSTGSFLWIASNAPESMGAHEPKGITVDSQGDVYITGGFGWLLTHEPSYISFGSYNLHSQGGEELFVVKITTHGQIRWALSTSGISGGWRGNQGTGIGIHSDGSIYVTGIFQGVKVNFGSFVLDSIDDLSSFLWKINLPENQR